MSSSNESGGHTAGGPTRRQFVGAAAALAGLYSPLSGLVAAGRDPRSVEPEGAQARAAASAGPNEIGIVSWSFRAYFRGDGPGRGRPGPVPILEEKKFDLLHFPQMVKERYGFTLLDLVNNHFTSTDSGYLEKLTMAMARSGSRVWNVKIDLPRSNISAADAALRKESLRRNKEWLDIASRIGSPHARVNSGEFTGAENMQLTIDSYKELAEYAKTRGVKIVVENHGGVTRSPEAMLEIVRGVKDNIATGPDTHNFNEQALFEGLRKVFPYAVTCDVKAMDIGPDGEHREYDLGKAVNVGLEAGYTGPWMIEYVGRTVDPFEGVERSRDLLAKWLAGAKRANRG